MSEPVTGWRFSIDGEVTNTSMVMAETAELPVPVAGENYIFDGVEYRVVGSQVNYVSGDPATAIAAVHLETITAE